MTSSDLRPRYLITSENENIGSGSFGTVKAAYPTNELDRSTAQAPCVAVKLIPLSLSEGLPSDAFREIKYSNILSTTTINPLTKELVRTESFTGVPKIIDAFVDKKSNNIVIVQELCSRLNLSSLIEWFGHVDMTRAFFAWLNQSLFVLATAEETGILNRDIKPHHLLINRNGSLAIIDWSLSTKHADNKYLTPYTFTFTVRPPEVFFYQQVAMDETKQSEPDDWCKINSLSGPEMPHPYSHEADMFSLGMSLITCLLGSEPVKYQEEMTPQIRQQSWMRKLYKWQGLSQRFIDMASGIRVDHVDETSYEFILSQYFRSCLLLGKTDPVCPFETIDDLQSVCKETRPVGFAVQKLIRKARKWSRPNWVIIFLERYGNLLLAMCNIDPDARPKALSLLQCLCQGEGLEYWQNQSLRFVQEHPDMLEPSFRFLPIFDKLVLEPIESDSEESTECLDRNPHILKECLLDLKQQHVLLPISISQQIVQRLVQACLTLDSTF